MYIDSHDVQQDTRPYLAWENNVSDTGISIRQAVEIVEQAEMETGEKFSPGQKAKLIELLIGHDERQMTTAAEKKMEGTNDI